MAGPGRPPWAPTPAEIVNIEALAAQGLTMEQIADSFGIHDSTLYDKASKNPEISGAIKRGRANGIATITNALFTAATKGKNVTAMIFYLKCRAGWKEEMHISGVSEEGGKLVINLAGVAGKPKKIDEEK